MIEIGKVSALLLTSIAVIISSFALCTPIIQTSYAQATINDPNLRAELVTGGMSFPTSMAFLDDNNILVLEKEGTVSLISNGIIQDPPVLQIPVDSKNERGLLGIAISRGDGNSC